MKRFAFALLLVAGCGSTNHSGFSDDASAGDDATTQAGDAGGDAGPQVFGSDSGVAQDCSPTSQDLEGCTCGSPGATQACYTGDPKTRHVGNCTDGKQTCMKQGEFSTWGPCTGSYTPSQESCIGNVDTNCNGKIGCQDPQCATNPACNTGCTDGQTRPCYDGPPETENVGTCKDGTQTCVNGAWPSTCGGEVLPQPEACCDALDHNCNRLPGCLDLFACVTATCCQTSCQSPLDTGCVCPKGSGDTQTCPAGDHVVHKGGFPGTDECCPCGPSDCGDINCCGNGACVGASGCGVCHTLPPSCNGQVSTDCDDFPEDCDEPCCPCNDGSCPPP